MGPVLASVPGSEIRKILLWAQTGAVRPEHSLPARFEQRQGTRRPSTSTNQTVPIVAHHLRASPV